MKITVVYTSVDGGRIKRNYKKIESARKFAHYYVGSHPEIGFSYAVSGDGIGKVEVDGCSLKDLFPARVDDRFEWICKIKEGPYCSYDCNDVDGKGTRCEHFKKSLKEW